MQFFSKLAKKLLIHLLLDFSCAGVNILFTFVTSTLRPDSIPGYKYCPKLFSNYVKAETVFPYILFQTIICKFINIIQKCSINSDVVSTLRWSKLKYFVQRKNCGWKQNSHQIYLNILTPYSSKYPIHSDTNYKSN